MFGKIQALFVRVVHQLEHHPTPLGRYFLLFGAILAVRLALEFFSSHRLFTLDDILHIGLWFMFIVLAFMIQLQVFSGERIERVARLVVVCFTIALTAPIIDLIATQGVGAKMNYLSLNSWGDLLWSYITIGGSSLTRGATLGIRIEIVLLVIASFNYVRTKTGNWVLAILGAWCIYTVLFLSGAVPLLLGLLVDGFDLRYQPNDRSTLLLLLTLDLILLFVACWRYAPGRMRAFLWGVPWVGFAAAGICFGIGAWLALEAYPSNWTMDPTTLFWFALLPAWGICLGVMGSSARRLLPSGQSDKVGNGLLILVLGIGALVSVRTFFATALIWGLLFLLNEQPLQLRRVPILRNLLDAMVLVAAALAGFSTFGGPMVGFPKDWLMILLGVGFAGGILTSKLAQR